MCTLYSIFNLFLENIFKLPLKGLLCIAMYDMLVETFTISIDTL